MKPKVILDPIFGEIVDPEGTFIDELKKESEPVTEAASIIEAAPEPEPEPDYPGDIEMPKELMEELKDPPRRPYYNLGPIQLNACTQAMTILPSEMDLIRVLTKIGRNYQ